MAKRKVIKKKKKANGKHSEEDRFTKKIAISLFLIAGIGVATFFIIRNIFGEPESFESNKYFVKGVDVSHHNPILNWNIAMEQNISFAYIKATEGTTHEDRNYPYNYELAKKANVKIGSYHFYTFGISGKEQANHFIKIAQCNSGDLIPAIDVEHSPANPYNKDKEYIELVVKELKTLENALYEYYGVHPILYTNKDCYKLYIKENFPDNFIWMCDLHREPSDDIKNWRIWQFSHKGEIPGIECDIDLNYYRYSFTEFKELLLP